MAESWEMSGRERRYSVPVLANNNSSSSSYREGAGRQNTAEDLHAWSIYRQNLNSDFADSALGSNEKAPLPYGNFQLDSSTIQSILNHPKCGPKSELSSNTNAYLKFGLPRVVARSGREESSGYDSSNDGSPSLMRSGRNHLSKSDPDFRKNLIASHPNPTSVDTKWSREQRRMKSISEANLLSEGFRQRPDAAANSPSRPVSQQSKYSKMSYHSSRQQSRHQLRASQFNVNGNLSVYPPRDESMLNEKYFPRDEYFTKSDDHDDVYPKHPHLQLRGLCYEKTTKSGADRRVILDNISMEVKAGEIVGILATNEREGTSLLEILANQHSTWGFKVRGDVVFNGVTTSPAGLHDRVAFVQQDAHWCPDMTVRQILLFTALLQAPGHSNRNFDTKGRIDALINDLGLNPVRHTRVGHVTISERRRLSVACHLLLDTDVVLLDQPTKGMDIFDTFFLVEYLRQWAARGRIVMLSIHPPTYEIFTMLSRVALISSGRLMYCGRRREMLPYFAFIEFPCPAYKNPSDYYLDLVTLDDLTSEALLESSQRAELLAETFRRRQEPLSDPGPAGVLPPKIKRANFILQIAALWIRAIFFTFPTNVQRFSAMFVTSTLMSVLIGAVFYNLRSHHQEQEDVNDRLALHYVMASVAVWPTLMLMISDVWLEKNSVAHDVKDQLYGRVVYFLSKMSYSFLASIFIFAGYLIPAYALAGFETTNAGLITLATELGYMLLYLFAIRTMVLALASIFASRHAAAMVSGLMVSVVGLASGFVVQLQNMTWWTSWLRWMSPLYWTLHSLQPLDFANLTTVECSRNPLTRQETPGLVLKIQCGITNGQQALNYWAYDFDQLDHIYPIVMVVAFWLFFQLVQSVSLFFDPPRRKMSRHKRVQL